MGEMMQDYLRQKGVAVGAFSPEILENMSRAFHVAWEVRMKLGAPFASDQERLEARNKLAAMILDDVRAGEPLDTLCARGWLKRLS